MSTIALAQARWARWALCALLLHLLAGCAMSLVAEHDPASEERLVAVYERVSRHFDALAETAPADRAYAGFAKSWSDIATDLRVIALRQKMRSSNAESQKILDLLVDHWDKTRARHRQRSAQAETRADPYPDSLIALDRAQFEAQFVAAVAAEAAKR